MSIDLGEMVRPKPHLPTILDRFWDFAGRVAALAAILSVVMATLVVLGGAVL